VDIPLYICKWYISLSILLCINNSNCKFVILINDFQDLVLMNPCVKTILESLCYIWSTLLLVMYITVRVYYEQLCMNVWCVHQWRGWLESMQLVCTSCQLWLTIYDYMAQVQYTAHTLHAWYGSTLHGTHSVLLIWQYTTRHTLCTPDMAVHCTSHTATQQSTNQCGVSSSLKLVQLFCVALFEYIDKSF